MAILRLDTNPSKVLGKRLAFKMHVALGIQLGHKVLPSGFFSHIFVLVQFSYFVTTAAMRMGYYLCCSGVMKQLPLKSSEEPEGLKKSFPQNLFSHVKFYFYNSS